ncbi:DUF4282 domain-containing protein [Devosia sp.]|uniref:DUF4282 domain-containing protein n=1 Tax=Devosia sp. TaxID=1871048 RepID=UPI002EF993FF
MFRAFLSFDSFIFPKLTKLIYWIGLAAIALFTVIGALGALFAGGSSHLAGTGYNGFVAFLGILVGGALSALVWRIVVELWMVLFSIYDVLKEIRDQPR